MRLHDILLPALKKQKPWKVIETQYFPGFFLGTPEGTRTPNIQNRKQKLKNLVSIGALGASGFSIFVATAFATIAIFLATGAVQEGNPGV